MRRIFAGLLIAFIMALLLALNIYQYVRSPELQPGLGRDFFYLSPEIKVLDLNEFLDKKSLYTASYSTLREDVQKIINDSKGDYGVYFEDLTFHSWFGINEKKQFNPASMLKITSVASILKQVEQGETSLEMRITITSDDMNLRFGDMYTEVGDTLALKEIIEQALIFSDNTAVKILHKHMIPARWYEARLGMGLPIVSVKESEQGTSLSPKEMSNVFRSLYYSGYLSRTFSNWVLTLLSETSFNEGIPSGVPDDVVVSHKVGIWEPEGSVSDCGIVYASKPYILCIMSKNADIGESNKAISRISGVVYSFVETADDMDDI